MAFDPILVFRFGTPLQTNARNFYACDKARIPLEFLTKGHCSPPSHVYTNMFARLSQSALLEMAELATQAEQRLAEGGNAATIGDELLESYMQLLSRRETCFTTRGYCHLACVSIVVAASGLWTS